MFDNLTKLLLANGSAQALQLLALPILSRVFVPAEFGSLAEAQSLATLGAILATAQLHLTIPLTRTDDDARAATAWTQTFCLLVFAACAVPALILGWSVLVAVVLALCVGLANTYTGFLVYKGRFGDISRFHIIRAGLIVGSQLSLAALSVSGGLLYGCLVGEGLAAAYLRLVAVGPLSLRAVRLREVFDYASRHRAFAVFGTVQELLAVAAFYSPLLFFTWRFGDDVGGQYAMANRLVWAPVVLLSSNLAQVLYHRFAKLSAADLLREQMLSFQPVATAVLLAGCTSCFFLAPYLLWLLGPNWMLASQLLPVQVVWGAVFLLTVPYRVAYRALSLQRYLVWIDAGLLIGIGLLAVVPGLGPVAAMWWIAAATLAHGALSIAVARYIMKRRVAATGEAI